MIGAGTIINPIIKVVTTIVILGAVYLFFVKPALDTTEDISNRAFETSDSIQESIQQDVSRSLKQAQDSFDKNGIDVQVPDAGDGTFAASKLLECIQDANQDVARITRCNERFGP